MNEILYKKEIAANIFRMNLKAPMIVRNIKPGQFVIIIPKEGGERIPLTVFEAKEDSITIVFQVVGKTTKKLSLLEPGQSLFSLLGPLGKPSEISCNKKVVCIGGGVGAAVLYPEIQALKKAGNTVITILGAREKNLIIVEDEIKQFSDRVFIMTDDGSYGEKGNVLLPLERLLASENIDEVIAIGPVIMMKFISELTAKYNVKTVVSLNPLMVDGTGMCGCCRVEVGGKTRFACVDGPEFDGHLVNFTELLNRNRQYQEEERG